MTYKAIRGAITSDNNTVEDIKNAVVEMLEEIIKANNLKTEEIIFANFTMTDDLDKVNPARVARENLISVDFSHIPMMCYRELKIENDLKKCIRVMLLADKSEVKHVYLKGAKALRVDIN